MTYDQWRKEIIKACKGIGTHKKEFSAVINTLSSVLEQRDIAYAQYVSLSGTPLIIEEADDGKVNIRYNAALKVWTDLNKEALNYWRELGLTPAGLKKITDQLEKPKSENNMSKLLKEMSK